MKSRGYLFLIMIFCMSIICAVRSTELANDAHEFHLGIILGISQFVLGFMWFGMATVALGVLFKSVWGDTKIYILFNKWLSFSLILWFVVSIILCLSTLIDSEYASNFFIQCLVCGIFTETWVYKNFLEKNLIEKIKTNKKK